MTMGMFESREKLDHSHIRDAEATHAHEEGQTVLVQMSCFASENDKMEFMNPLMEKQD